MTLKCTSTSPRVCVNIDRSSCDKLIEEKKTIINNSCLLLHFLSSFFVMHVCKARSEERKSDRKKPKYCNQRLIDQRIRRTIIKRCVPSESIFTLSKFCFIVLRYKYAKMFALRRRFAKLSKLKK